LHQEGTEKKNEGNKQSKNGWGSIGVSNHALHAI